MIDVDSPHIRFVPLDEATEPRDGECIVDHWWIVHPDRGLVMGAVHRRRGPPARVPAAHPREHRHRRGLTVGTPAIFRTKRDAALSALSLLEAIRPDEVPTGFTGGKFTDPDAGWYVKITFVRAAGNTVDARPRPEYVTSQIERCKGAILDWMASTDTHTKVDD